MSCQNHCRKPGHKLNWSHIYPFGGDHPRDGNCPRDGDCPNDSDHSIDGGYPCILESSASICHIIQNCKILPKKVCAHPWKMGDHPGEVGHPNRVDSIGTIRCNLTVSCNNWQCSLIFLTQRMNETNETHAKSHILRQHAA